MTAKDYLQKKGIFSLETKKRTDEVLEWMEGFAKEYHTKQLSIDGVSKSFYCDWARNGIINKCAAQCEPCVEMEKYKQ